MQDFKPRAGGKIRVTGTGDVRNAVASIDQQDPTPSMLHQESNTKGMIEVISAHFDGSPGTMGTKQEHKTKGGLELIQSNMNTRFLTNQRHALVNEARRMQSMSEFFSQFHFEKMPFRIYHDDGTTALADFNKDDIFTEGRGFEFAIEIDPNFGDEQNERQQNLFLMDRGMEYEKYRMEVGDPSMRKLNVSKLFEKTLNHFGYRDTSRLFSLPNNSQSPENELTVLMQGGKVECSGDLQHHILTHILQLGAPNLKKAVEAGKAHPDTLKNLQFVIEQAGAKLKTFLQDPQAAASAKLNEAMRNAPGAER